MLEVTAIPYDELLSESRVQISVRIGTREVWIKHEDLVAHSPKTKRIVLPRWYAECAELVGENQMQRRESNVVKLKKSRQLEWGVMAAIAIFIIAGLITVSAFAGTVTVTYDPPADPDLKECRFFLQNAQGGAIADRTVAAGMLGPGKQVLFEYDTVSLQGSEGKVVARCEDLAGQVSVDTTPLAAIFPDVAPGTVRLLGVQVAP